MSIIYALVSRRQNVLVEYSDPAFQGNYRQTCHELLRTKIEDLNGKKSLMTNTHGFHYLAKEGLIVLCMAELDCDRNICFKYIHDVMNLFLDTFGDRWQNAIAYSLTNDFEGQLKRKMTEANSNTNDKIGQILDTLDQTKNVMVENIENVLSRGEKLEVLVEKAEDLNDTAMTFQSKAKVLRNQMWWKNFRYSCAVFLIVAGIVYLIIAVTCSPTFDC